MHYARGRHPNAMCGMATTSGAAKVRCRQERCTEINRTQSWNATQQPTTQACSMPNKCWSMLIVQGRMPPDVRCRAPAPARAEHFCDTLHKRISCDCCSLFQLLLGFCRPPHVALLLAYQLQQCCCTFATRDTLTATQQLLQPPRLAACWTCC